jgi:hypothetical protein
MALMEYDDVLGDVILLYTVDIGLFICRFVDTSTFRVRIWYVNHCDIVHDVFKRFLFDPNLIVSTCVKSTYMLQR